ALLRRTEHQRDGGHHRCLTCDREARMGDRPRVAAARDHGGRGRMTPERWQRVKEVFSAASALAEPERMRYLDEACGDDAELRAEVTSLLGVHDQSDAVVDRPAAAYFHDSSFLPGGDRRIGQRIGAYEIVALIGHGGMGEVYRARRVDAEY